ncbi:unnamed protein product [marine sediment metagenome]|uniref:HTH cro/C1-type domain-containing protein n=1 Tax=marine sediment metagenome TaxID=412755 RepID=X0SWI0_9ZZZZ
MQQKELARAFGVSRETIRRYEKDMYKPNKQILLQLEEIFDEKF